MPSSRASRTLPGSNLEHTGDASSQSDLQTGQRRRLDGILQDEGRLDDDTSDLVWVDIRGGPPVLEVAVALGCDVTWDTDRGASVGDTGGEGADVTSLVLSSQSHVVVLAVHLDVLGVALAELLNCGLDGLHATLLSHRLRRVVGVAAGTVPVAWDGLGVERDLDTPLLSNSNEEVSRNDKVVTHLDALAWANLELPLSWHDLSVDTRNVDTRVKAGSVVALDDVTGKDLASTNTTVVWALWRWETALWPAVWLVVDVEESVFLLETKPWLLGCGLLHNLVGVVSVVGLVWGSIRVVALGKNNDVVSPSEWVREEGGWSEVDVRVVAWRLV